MCRFTVAALLLACAGPPVDAAVDGFQTDTGQPEVAHRIDEDAPTPPAPLAPCLEPAPPGELEVELGRLTAGVFSPLEDGDEIEIIQGEQGGVHVEVAVRVYDTGESQAKLLADIEAGTYQPCGSGEPAQVGSLSTAKHPLFVVDDADEYQSGKLVVIFEQNQGHYYADRPCGVSVRVSLTTVDRLALRSGSAVRTLRCTNFF